MKQAVVHGDANPTSQQLEIANSISFVNPRE
jgi:hypothetical protein